MISERTLKQWRKEALNNTKEFDPAFYADTVPGLVAEHKEYLRRVLKMTQELLDQHLIQK